MSKHNSMDLTRDRPIMQILLFSLPLVIGTLFQQLYSFMDTIMVGQLISEEALAAVGTTYSLNFLILGFIQGACVGFGIPLARSIGAKSASQFKRYFWNGVWICAIFGAFLTFSAFLLSEPLLRLIQTPDLSLPTSRSTSKSFSWSFRQPSSTISATACCARPVILSAPLISCWHPAS